VTLKEGGHSKCHEKHSLERVDYVKSYLMANYGEVEGSIEEGFYRFKLNEMKVSVDPVTLKVESDNKETEVHLSKTLKQIAHCVSTDMVI
jgi:hypothetical protein